MSLNNTPSAERLHIGIFGKRNAGKSSVINALTGQNLAIVSDIKGTTTDPVLKSMELLPLVQSSSSILRDLMMMQIFGKTAYSESLSNVE